ncbi:hypothetical protein M407DRAFT_245166 [Tulasnella calospora MUT 4182]|uniref:Uncharacterized protein n=1 Tax=Tulasnella calospora MUT 4182 TaxID=1051891 RepID=A0A0C3QBG4_9AGAM|nr:hypothetical protein M407DRAFT_245166 [Tulasnella calospora MUT 4182]
MAAPAPARRLSQRRGSMVAPDPFGIHDIPTPASGSSRITIVRVPTVKDTSAPAPTPPSPGATYHSRDRESGSSLARRSSWGSNRSGSSDFGSGSAGAGGGRGRMSFAFASFTPIHPPSGPAVLDRGGAVTPTSSGPPSPSSFRSQRRSFSNPAQAQPVPRAQPLTPQQLYEVAQQATNPSQAGSSSPKYGYGGAPIPASQASTQGEGPAPFVPLPNEVYLPFINRPQEIQQLLSTPQTSRLFALLASTFPQEPTGASISRPSSSMSVRTAGGTPIHSSSHPQYTLDELPKDPREWSFSHLSFWLRHVTRPEAPDREWIHAIRVCVNSRSEVLWQRFAGALGVPPGFEEEEEESALVDEDEFLEGDERPVGIGRTTKGPAVAALKERIVDVASEKAESEAADEGEYFGGEELDFEEEYDPSSLPGSEAMIEPITASSLPPPPGPANLVSPPGEGLGLTPNEGHSLEGVTEEEEPEEESLPASSPAPTSEDPILHTLPSSSSSSSVSKTFLGPGGQYAPKTHSPLAGEPTLNVIGPSPKLGDEGEQQDPEIDFPAQPDPNAEPIQGIRIMNAPMTLFPSLTSDEAVPSSPLTYTPPHTSQPVSPPRGGGSGVVAETGVLRPRTGSNSSFRAQLLSGGRLGGREPAHQRTQSFGAYGMHTRKGSSSAPHSPLSPFVAGGPLFPGSFAGLGSGSPGGTGGTTGPAMLLRNPRAPPGGRPAGISLGAGMHYTPRSGRASGGVIGESAVSLTSESGGMK